MSAGPRNALAAWGVAGIYSVLLPSGFWMRFRVPDAADMLRHGLVPPDLREVALAYAAKGIDMEQADDKILSEVLSLTDTLCAHALRALLSPDDAPPEGAEPRPNDPAWQPVTLSGAEFGELDMPGDDKATIRALVLRRMTPRQATFLSRTEMGFPLAPADQEQAREEESATTTGWKSFREERGGGERGDHREDVAGTAEHAARRRGPHDRVVARRRIVRAGRRGTGAG